MNAKKTLEIASTIHHSDPAPRRNRLLPNPEPRRLATQSPLKRSLNGINYCDKGMSLLIGIALVLCNYEVYLREKKPKHVMKKSATTIEEQIEKLKQRGMAFEDEDKAKENLYDIGYYRLGFYWFPFEKTFPRAVDRSHEFVAETKFEYAIQLYYFDFDLRNVFLKYIARIEINFRTKLIYYVSNQYKQDPLWYLNGTVVKRSFLKNVDYQNALKTAKNEKVIKQDLATHKTNDAPAWKIMEFFSFGIVISLYENLIDGKLRKTISDQYGVPGPNMLTDYLHTIRRLRNSCAHGKVLFDFNLPNAISTNGPAKVNNNSKTNLSGAYAVLKYILGIVSENRILDMKNKLYEAFDKIEYEQVKDVIHNNSGLRKEIL